MPNIIFVPSNWYWIVAGSATQVYSSAHAGYVAADDATYQGWLAAGGVPTPIDSETSLYGVLSTQYPLALGTLGTVPQRAATLLANGTTITLASTSTPALNGTYAVDQAHIANITAVQTAIASGVGLPGGGGTLPWADALNADHAFTGPQFTAFAAAVMNYVFGLIRCAQGKLPGLPSAALTIA